MLVGHIIEAGGRFDLCSESVVAALLPLYRRGWVLPPISRKHA